MAEPTLAEFSGPDEMVDAAQTLLTNRNLDLVVVRGAVSRAVCDRFLQAKTNNAALTNWRTRVWYDTLPQAEVDEALAELWPEHGPPGTRLGEFSADAAAAHIGRTIHHDQLGVGSSLNTDEVVLFGAERVRALRGNTHPIEHEAMNKYMQSRFPNREHLPEFGVHALRTRAFVRQRDLVMHTENTLHSVSATAGRRAVLAAYNVVLEREPIPVPIAA